MTSGYLTFDDVLIKPQFSTINSRKDVSLYSRINSWGMDIPVISANMDTVTGATMAHTMKDAGAQACLHRFWSIEENVEAFMSSPLDTAVSIGLGDKEKERAEALLSEKAWVFVIDVAHGAQVAVAEQLKWLKQKKPHALVVVGNFASGSSVKDFLQYIGDRTLFPDAVKVGIGPGSACTTRVKTGCGMPQLSAIMDVKSVAERGHVKVIADGGMRTPGDIAKALAAGADMVMLGGMLAGTSETPNMFIPLGTDGEKTLGVKSYRGSASKESYAAQGKDETWRTAEGESFTVPYKGSVKSVLKDIEGGLRSAFTYVGASNLEEFQKKSEFIQITSSSVTEGKAHGKDQK